MRSPRYIVPLVLWSAITIALCISAAHVNSSSHARVHEKCVAVFVSAGVGSGVVALMLAFARQQLALSFGTFAIIHGVALPFLLWPSSVQFYGVGLIVPAISVVTGLRSVMMQLRQKKL
jgi:hypothetical protein